MESSKSEPERKSTSSLARIEKRLPLAKKWNKNDIQKTNEILELEAKLIDREETEYERLIALVKPKDEELTVEDTQVLGEIIKYKRENYEIEKASKDADLKRKMTEKAQNAEIEQFHAESEYKRNQKNRQELFQRLMSMGSIGLGAFLVATEPWAVILIIGGFLGGGVPLDKATSVFTKFRVPFKKTRENE